jgi:hypothetical protein
MGLDLTYDADGVIFTHRFSRADWQTIEALRSHRPAEVGTCFDVPELGRSVQIGTAALKDAALAVDRFLSENAHLLPASYQFRLERFPVPGMPAGEFDTGGFSGLRLPNDPDHVYSIQAGLNELVLKKTARGADGWGVTVEVRDLRGESELVTENAGRVQFRRRAAKTTLRRALREIAAFADCVVSEKLTKVVG